jgi:hypothetical protein
VRELRPLTRGMVAEYVGVHESTVSRATAEKYLMLPNREVIPFSTFFSASLSTKDIIRELIEREQRALTDEEICTRLQEQGVRIARRTVAKYRATLGILPSTFRVNRPADQWTGDAHPGWPNSWGQVSRVPAGGAPPTIRESAAAPRFVVAVARRVARRGRR